MASAPTISVTGIWTRIGELRGDVRIAGNAEAQQILQNAEAIANGGISGDLALAIAYLAKLEQIMLNSETSSNALNNFFAGMDAAAREKAEQQIQLNAQELGMFKEFARTNGLLDGIAANNQDAALTIYAETSPEIARALSGITSTHGADLSAERLEMVRRSNAAIDFMLTHSDERVRAQGQRLDALRQEYGAESVASASLAAIGMQVLDAGVVGIERQPETLYQVALHEVQTISIQIATRSRAVLTAMRHNYPADTAIIDEIQRVLEQEGGLGALASRADLTIRERAIVDEYRNTMSIGNIAEASLQTVALHSAINAPELITANVIAGGLYNLSAPAESEINARIEPLLTHPALLTDSVNLSNSMFSAPPIQGSFGALPDQALLQIQSISANMAGYNFGNPLITHEEVVRALSGLSGNPQNAAAVEEALRTLVRREGDPIVTVDGQLSAEEIGLALSRLPRSGREAWTQTGVH